MNDTAQADAKELTPDQHRRLSHAQNPGIAARVHRKFYPARWVEYDAAFAAWEVQKADAVKEKMDQSALQDLACDPPLSPYWQDLYSGAIDPRQSELEIIGYHGLKVSDRAALGTAQAAVRKLNDQQREVFRDWFLTREQEHGE